MEGHVQGLAPAPPPEGRSLLHPRMKVTAWEWEESGLFDACPAQRRKAKDFSPSGGWVGITVGCCFIFLAIAENKEWGELLFVFCVCRLSLLPPTPCYKKEKGRTRECVCVSERGKIPKGK